MVVYFLLRSMLVKNCNRPLSKEKNRNKLISVRTVNLASLLTEMIFGKEMNSS